MHFKFPNNWNKLVICLSLQSNGMIQDAYLRRISANVRVRGKGIQNWNNCVLFHERKFQFPDNWKSLRGTMLVCEANKKYDLKNCMFLCQCLQILIDAIKSICDLEVLMKSKSSMINVLSKLIFKLISDRTFRLCRIKNGKNFIIEKKRTVK